MKLGDLNPMQRMAAETTEGPVLILAGAGSGKTRTITYRIAHLLEKGVRPWNILALTFTNKAAKEMRGRIEQLVDSQTLDDIWIGTFHSVCVRILRRDIDKIGFSNSFVIYDTDDSLRVLKDVIKTLNLDDSLFDHKELRPLISDAKNRMLRPDDWFAESLKDYKSQKIHEIYTLYETRLKNANALDFDDLLLDTLQLFADHPPVLDYYRKRFQYIHVDEYQDTNLVQYQFIQLLAKESRNLCVVGDDDQSIYGWRGADIRNILNFEVDFPDAKVIKLEQNYRSTSNILDAANQVIAHNSSRKDKVLWTESGDGEPISLYAAGDDREEAAWICDKIRNLKNSSVPLGDIAVLYRKHRQSRVLEEMFMRSGIPYKVYGGPRFYDRKEIKDLLAYLRIIQNPLDDVSLLRIINTPRRSIGDATISILRNAAQSQNIPLFSILHMLPDELSSRAKKSVGEFALLLNKLQLEKNKRSLSDYVEYVLQESGLKARQIHEEGEEARARMENLDEFVNAAHEFENRSEEKTLDAFLENVALVSDLDRQEDKPNYVTLMTLHSSKGLEYNTVFIAGMEEGIFPDMRSLANPKNMEEERRLCYVGITRAMRRLYLSYARRRMLSNQLTFSAPSIFIKEIPERLLKDEWAAAAQRVQSPGMERVFSSSDESYFASSRMKRARNLSFGTPGMGQRDPITIPGVTKGFGNTAAQKSVMAEIYQPGDIILHRKFGKGTVLGVTGTGSDAMIHVSFTAYGERTFSLSIAPIVKIDD